MIAIMSQLVELLSPLLDRELSAEAGTILFRQGDTVRHLFVVRHGCIHLERGTPDGARAVMQRAGPKDVLAESSIYSPAYHCDGVVVADSTVARADMPHVRNALASDSALLQALTRHLAGEVMRTRSRVEILAQRTVRERLDSWLAFNQDALPPKGMWRTVAEDIGVSPEAFYRELQRRRR